MTGRREDATTVLAFDAYGTLLSTQSIADKLASHFGEEKAQAIATTWRKYQLEYTWRLNSMNQYEDFSILTRRSLKHALAEAAVSLDEKGVEEMMHAYDSLSCFPDVAKTMESLKAVPNVRAVVFSNGTHTMVSNSVNNSPDLSPYAKNFEDIISIDEVRKFKPAPEAYHHLAEKLAKELKDIWLVSSNPFDVVGARAVGMKAIWIDRAGNGWRDSLIEGGEGRPTEIVKRLDEVMNAVSKSHG
ncbi:hypothetical protein B0A55_01825 [Friedmanniomyces simplex]|uniref:Haloacid dehalogenase, type II n=1 Tax=Friedmanniomyces simplex TaxID=329884 RepID=A0A4V5NKU0_9PEZI|nr:hypothetical protein B0A55_01825 [Friedmanniomyces simplex]